MTELLLAESIEWLTVSRPHIAVGELTATGDFVSQRPLKGKPPVIARKGHSTRTAACGSSRSERGPAASVVGFINGEGYAENVFDLGIEALKESDPAVSASFNVLDGRGILDLIDDVLSEPYPMPLSDLNPCTTESPQRSFLRFKVPTYTDAHRVLGDGTAYLVVPAYDEFLDELTRHTHNENPWERARAAHQLGNYAYPHVKERLREMLRDPEGSVVTEFSAICSERVTMYPARQVAWDVLAELGLETSKPAGYREDFPYEMVLIGSDARGT